MDIFKQLEQLEILARFTELATTPGEKTFVEKQARLEELFTLLDNQYDLSPELRKSIWELYLVHQEYKNLLTHN